ncbi:MAG: VanZ family protein [candidate division Zixibacteria bacterium]|nr:VanZ family protein [candidate division Zixibacteria bacterium]
MNTAAPQSRLRTFVRYHLPLILYSLAILLVSSIPNFRVPLVPFHGADKVAHFLEYAVFAALCFRSFVHLSARITRNGAFWCSVGFLLLFALVDESVQRFTPGRQSDLVDYVTDLLGGLLVLIVLRVRNASRTSI